MKTILLTYLRPKMLVMSVGIVVKFLGTIVELLLPWMLSVVLDEFVPEKNLEKIILWGVLMILCAGLALLGNVVANRMATRVSREFTRHLRRDLFRKITDLSCAQIDRFTVPSLISRLTTDTYNLHATVDRMQRLGIRAPILLIGGITVTFVIEPVLTSVMIAVLPLLLVIVVFVSRRGIRLYAKTQAALDRMVRCAQESISGIRVVQALSKAEYEKNRFNGAAAAVAENDYRAAALMNVTNPAMNLLLNAGLTLVVVVGAYRVDGGRTTPGTIVAFLSYFTIILNALMMTSRLFVIYSKGIASGHRIADVLNAPAEMGVVQLPSGGGDDHIRFDHVGFSYSKVRENFKDISFSLKHGETLGIIGATGSGKSTLIQLLLRFYDPDDGAIYLDGQDLRTIPDETLHTRFGVAFQNDFLFAGSVAENIDIGRGLPRERIAAAGVIAQAGFIEERDGTYAGEIASGGSDLSGGQKQRLLIARALAGAPEILVLDDSSSALDYKTDAAFRRALGENFSGTTKVIVASRVSSIRNADKILVLDDGGAIGYGTHDELMERCVPYCEMATFQMQEVE